MQKAYFLTTLRGNTINGEIKTQNKNYINTESEKSCLTGKLGRTP